MLVFLAHLTQRLIGELIDTHASASVVVVVVVVHHFQTSSPLIKAKSYVEPPWEGGTKVYINGPGHMTKMAAMPIYGKNLKKSYSPELEVL